VFRVVGTGSILSPPTQVLTLLRPEPGHLIEVEQGRAEEDQGGDEDEWNQRGKRAALLAELPEQKRQGDRTDQPDDHQGRQ